MPSYHDCLMIVPHRCLIFVIGNPYNWKERFDFFNGAMPQEWTNWSTTLLLVPKNWMRHMFWYHVNILFKLYCMKDFALWYLRFCHYGFLFSIYILSKVYWKPMIYYVQSYMICYRLECFKKRLLYEVFSVIWPDVKILYILCKC